MPPFDGVDAGEYAEGGMLAPPEEGVPEGVELPLEERNGSIGGTSRKSIICTGGGLMQRGWDSSGGGEPGGGGGGGMLSSSGSTCSCSSRLMSCNRKIKIVLHNKDIGTWL